jgi:hypothetical protein
MLSTPLKWRRYCYRQALRRVLDANGLPYPKGQVPHRGPLYLAQINAPFLRRKGWEATVNKMINVMGAPIKPEDVPPILNYLSQHYRKP